MAENILIQTGFTLLKLVLREHFYFIIFKYLEILTGTSFSPSVSESSPSSLLNIRNTGRGKKSVISVVFFRTNSFFLHKILFHDIFATFWNIFFPFLNAHCTTKNATFSFTKSKV